MANPLNLAPKLFTIEEANAIIPILEDRLGRFESLYAKLESARHELSVMRLVSSSGGDQDNPDRRALTDLESKAKKLTIALARIQRELLHLGCTPKSFPDGLIDFFALKEGRLVFLCWKRGETDVAHWHTLDSGFRGRMPIRSFIEDDAPASDASDPD